jgi:hypothetical protein
MMTKTFILYDGRARTTGDTEEATVLDTAESEDEIRQLQSDYPHQHPTDSIWYEYELHGNRLANGKPRPDLDEK